MKVLVSACILGCNCKYNGKNNKNEKIIEYISGHDVISICPEIMGGMPSPRPCVEIVDGVIMDEYGSNVDNKYRKGVEESMNKIEGKEIDLAILQSRSPTCGAKEIYDGTFSGKLIKEQGIFAKALIEKGIKVIDAKEFK